LLEVITNAQLMDLAPNMLLQKRDKQIPAVFLFRLDSGGSAGFPGGRGRSSHHGRLSEFRGNSAFYATNTKRYVVGPTVQFHFPPRLTLEIDGLYRRLGYQYQQITPTTVFRSTVANSWEFPALVKFDVLPGPIRPFVGAGASFRHISGIEEVQRTVTAGGLIAANFNNAPEFNKRNDIGLVLGGGVTFKFGRVRISPEFRYTRWGSEAFRDPVRALLNSNRNQGDFLLGLTF
jgi:hypothetical protein